MTLEEKQNAIDKICSWIGWHKAKTPIEGVWWWIDAQDNRMAGALFNPFTSPNDCNRVMDEVAKGDMAYGTTFEPRATQGRKYMAYITPNRYGYSDDSWMDAFCLAVLEIIIINQLRKWMF